MEFTSSSAEIAAVRTTLCGRSEAKSEFLRGRLSTIRPKGSTTDKVIVTVEAALATTETVKVATNHLPLAARQPA